MVALFFLAASKSTILEAAATNGLGETAAETSMPLRFAVVVATAYIAWLAVFEAWLEPWLRSRVGALVGYSIVWRNTGGPLRVWRDPSGRLDGSGVVALAGHTAVLCAAVFPSAIVPALLHWVAPFDAAVKAAGYLLAVPMTALFALHVMAARPGGDVARAK